MDILLDLCYALVAGAGQMCDENFEPQLSAESQPELISIQPCSDVKYHRKHEGPDSGLILTVQ